MLVDGPFYMGHCPEVQVAQESRPIDGLAFLVELFGELAGFHGIAPFAGAVCDLDNVSLELVGVGRALDVLGEFHVPNGGRRSPRCLAQ